MITINQDVRVGIRLPYEIDNMTTRYRTENGLYVFTSPSIEIIEKYLFYLLRNSKIIQFDQKYRYKPSYLSYDVYGTVNLEYLLMYINGVYCIEEFNLSEVIIPTIESIIYICKDKFSVEKDPLTLDEIKW